MFASLCRFEGKEPEALAFAIMKHDTVWGSTSRAIVQLLRRGRKGRKQLGQMIEGVLVSPEVEEFLEGLDTRPAQTHSIFGEGAWRALSRLFCLVLPSQRTRYELPQICFSCRGIIRAMYGWILGVLHDGVTV